MNAIPIKIQCGCGQKYAFDVEPVGGQMPGAVACPACGADGTAAANMLLAQHVTVPRPAPAANPANGAVRVAMPASPAARVAPAGTAPAMTPVVSAGTAPTRAAAAPAATPPGRPTGRLPGQLDENQARVEARAKILWGDAPEDVVKFLRMQGIAPAEANALVEALCAERAATIRANGGKKIIKGIALICVPVVAGVIFLIIGYFPLKIFAAAVAVGLYGLYLLLKGIMMFVAPKGEPGDVSEQ